MATPTPMDRAKTLGPAEDHILRLLTAPMLLSEIGRVAHLPRSTTEYNLRKLVQKRKVRTAMYRKRRLYARVEKKIESSSNFASDILAFPGVTVYRSKEGVEQVWREIITKPAGKRLVGIQPRKSFREGIRKGTRESVQRVSQALSDKRFIIDAIVHEDLAHTIFDEYRSDAKEVAKAFTGRPEDMVVVPNDLLDEKAELFVIENDLFLVDWFSEFALKITNHNIVSFILALFYTTKAYGKRYEQGKYIESLIERA